MARSGATPSAQSGRGNDGNEGLILILQSSSITRTSQSDCLVSYIENSLAWVGVLTLCIEAVDVFYSPSRLDTTVVDKIAETR